MAKLHETRVRDLPFGEGLGAFAELAPALRDGETPIVVDLGGDGHTAIIKLSIEEATRLAQDLEAAIEQLNRHKQKGSDRCHSP